jgi:CRISPR-associated protein Cas1
MNVTISDYGSFIGLKSQRLRILKGGKVEQEIPIIDLETLTVLGKGVSLSANAIAACVEHGVQIDFHKSSGDAYAKLTSPHLVGTVITRREQMAAYLDSRGVAASKAFILGRLKNQAAALKYFAKYRRERHPECYETLVMAAERMAVFEQELENIQGEQIDLVRGQLMSIEGRAGEGYWHAVRALLPDDAEFPGRLGRGATDPVNSCLNYAYGILYARCWGALNNAGLEPFAGFLHTDRPGKPSMVLDFIEEFRCAVADRSVFALFNKGFRPTLEEGRLDEAARKVLAEKVLARLEMRYRYGRKQLRYASIMVAQARKLALYLRNEGTYEPFTGSWL